ncbi:hypothetical protein EDB89DRAFT_1902675 [Lactarius sanguifluus]|nr:hypothetical protein EDB89DRAFT_1902675 [Lactarius sanguifluus]
MLGWCGRLAGSCVPCWGGVTAGWHLQGLVRGVGVEWQCGILRAMGRHVTACWGGDEWGCNSSGPVHPQPWGGLHGGNHVEKKWIKPPLDTIFSTSHAATYPPYVHHESLAFLLPVLPLLPLIQQLQTHPFKLFSHPLS